MTLTARHYFFIFACLLLFIALAACAGLDLGDILHARTPSSIQQSSGLPASLSLNEAELEYQRWYTNTQSAGAQWKASIERTNELRGLFSQLTLGALNDAGPTLSGIPILGPALPALTALTGLFLGRSGIRKEKEKSYNAGLDKAAEIAPTKSA